jgi:Gram-negative bacterial TonB protein C-terminal
MLSGMKFAWRVVCWMLICGPVAAWAGSSVPVDIQQLKGRIVFLWGMEAGDKLSFDAQGNLIDTTKENPFAESVLKIDKVRELKGKLEIDGERLVLIAVPSRTEPSKTDFYLVLIWKSIKISIAYEPNRPEELDAAVHKIFSFSMRDYFAGPSRGNVNAVLASLGLSKPPSELPDAAAMMKLQIVNAPPATGRSAAHGAVIPPLMIYSVAPAFSKDKSISEKKIRMPFAGACVVGLVVATNGIPTDIHIARSLSPELDLAAIDAVRQYRFLPAIAVATRRPVAVVIDIEVTFRIH